MALVFKKIAEYDWQVTVETPDKGKFKQETFTAKFKNIGRKAFAKLVEEPVSYTHLRAQETGRNLVCRHHLEK